MVSGLADASGVDEERALVQFDGYAGGEFQELAGEGIRVDAAEEWNVGVSDETVTGLQVFEAGEGRGLGDEIFPDRILGGCRVRG